MSWKRNKPKKSKYVGKPSFLKGCYSVKTDNNGDPYIVNTETSKFVRYLTINDYKKYEAWMSRQKEIQQN